MSAVALQSAASGTPSGHAEWVAEAQRQCGRFAAKLSAAVEEVTRLARSRDMPGNLFEPIVALTRTLRDTHDVAQGLWATMNAYDLAAFDAAVAKACEPEWARLNETIDKYLAAAEAAKPPA